MLPVNEDALVGCLLGMALGDSIGLWCEGMAPQRQRRLAPGPLQQRLLFNRGMVSDDTEHACMTAQALIVSAGDPDRFECSLAWRLRWWLVGIPAGIGWATLRALVKLWLGFPSTRSGVYSAGNGPCMLAPILGVAHGHDSARLRALVHRATRLTHRDPRAEQAVSIIASAAHLAATRAADTDRAANLARPLSPVWARAATPGFHSSIASSPARPVRNRRKLSRSSSACAGSQRLRPAYRTYRAARLAVPSARSACRRHRRRALRRRHRHDRRSSWAASSGPPSAR